MLTHPHFDVAKKWHRFIKSASYTFSHFIPKKASTSRQQWVLWAHRLPRSAFIIWLASHIADELIDQKYSRLSNQELADSVVNNSSCMLQHEAEIFIERYYFGYSLFDPHAAKLVSIFRKIVVRKLLHHEKL